MPFVRFLFRLFSIPSRNDSRNFTDFFSKDRHIRQFIEISDAGCLYPLINLLLGFFNRHDAILLPVPMYSTAAPHSNAGWLKTLLLLLKAVKFNVEHFIV